LKKSGQYSALMLIYLCACGTWAYGSPEVDKSAKTTTLSNRVALIEDGQDALLIRLHLIQSAQHTLDIQTFIWEDDECGHLIMNACIEAARRGVRVRFLMDHFSPGKDMDTYAALAQVHPNLEIRRYRPPANRLNTSRGYTLFHTAALFRNRNQRMHNKTVIADNHTALISGRNLSNHYFNQGSDRNYRDRDVLLRGPLVDKVNASFEDFWRYDRSVSLMDLVDVRAYVEEGSAPSWIFDLSDYASPEYLSLFKALENPAELAKAYTARLYPVHHAEIVADAPGKNSSSGLMSLWGGGESTSMLMDVLQRADKTIYMQSTYMIMDRRSRRFFKRLTDADPELAIHVSTNSYASTGNMMTYSGAFRHRPNVLRLGFQVYEFKPEPEDLHRYVPNIDSLGLMTSSQERSRPYLSIHAKVLVVDSRLAYVGSFNFDPRSMHLNTELGILIEDERFAAELEASIQNDMAPRNSWQVGWRTFPLSKANRAAERISSRLPLHLWPIASTTTFEVDKNISPNPLAVNTNPQSRKSLGPIPDKDNWSKKRWTFRLFK